LLEITKNNEIKYQQLKKAAEDELKSLLTAKFVGKRSVKAGDALGLMGNTGYSFGDHLHFGLYNLREEAISSWTYQNDIDSSDFLHQHILPMNEPLTITQERGQTKYSYLYSDHFHHGVDFVSPNKTVRAVADGVAYFFRNPGSSLGNHVKLFHPDGKMTLYLHLQ
jgi:murein DD-endopeptidase MepM/ murein hydrolase activator NlpD